MANVRYVAGTIRLSRQMFEEAQAHHADWEQLQATALNYSSASPEDRAKLDAVLEALGSYEEYG